MNLKESCAPRDIELKLLTCNRWERKCLYYNKLKSGKVPTENLSTTNAFIWSKFRPYENMDRMGKRKSCCIPEIREICYRAYSEFLIICWIARLNYLGRSHAATKPRWRGHTVTGRHPDGSIDAKINFCL
jgi:hypothetical protein